MSKVWKVLFVGLFVTNVGYSQVNRYVVHLADKEGTPYSIGHPEAFLSQKAIDRRLKQSIEVILEDLPVNPQYVAQIDDLSDDIQVFFTSKWLNNVLVQCPSESVSMVEGLPFVESVEYVAPGEKLTNQKTRSRTSNKKQRKKTRQVQAPATDRQNEMLGITQMHEDGFKGKEIDIAIMDGGFKGVQNISYFGHLFENDQLLYTYDYVSSGQNVYQYSDHGTKVLSLMAGYKAEEYVGASYESNYYLFVTEDVCNNCEHRIEEYNWLYAAEFADSAGVDIINTSLGYSIFQDPAMNYSIDDLDGKTAIISISASIAASKGILVVSSAGNEGNNSWGYITAPADAENMLSVGNVDFDGNRWLGSSHGNTFDGRTKPNLAAPGAGVAVINDAGNIVGGTGTSFSSPMTAGLAAGVWQANKALNATELRFFLQQSANQAATPDSLLGFGIPNYRSVQNLLAFQTKSSSFTLYPNPVSEGQLIIRVNNPDETMDSQVKIFDTQGKLVLETALTFSWQQLTHVVDMQFLDAGVYIINLNGANGVDKVRIVKI
jgi:subtilisin family serine protease